MRTKRRILLRILRSRTFTNKDSLRRLLSLVVTLDLRGVPDREFKELPLLVRLLCPDGGRVPTTRTGKPSSLLRTLMFHLRKTLGTYYRHEGAADPLWIELRKGNYRPQWIPKALDSLD